MDGGGGRGARRWERREPRRKDTSAAVLVFGLLVSPPATRPEPPDASGTEVQRVDALNGTKNSLTQGGGAAPALQRRGSAAPTAWPAFCTRWSPGVDF